MNSVCDFAKLFETLKEIFWWVVQFLDLVSNKSICLPSPGKRTWKLKITPLKRRYILPNRHFWVRSGSFRQRYSLLMFPALKMQVPQWKSKWLRFKPCKKKTEKSRSPVGVHSWCLRIWDCKLPGWIANSLGDTVRHRFFNSFETVAETRICLHWWLSLGSYIFWQLNRCSFVLPTVGWTLAAVELASWSHCL